MLTLSRRGFLKFALNVTAGFLFASGVWIDEKWGPVAFTASVIAGLTCLSVSLTWLKEKKVNAGLK